MAKFISDEDMAKMEAAQPQKPRFISDNEMASMEMRIRHAPQGEPERSWLDSEIPGGTPRGYIKGTLEALPLAGALAGGVAGTAIGGPVGAVGVGALGAAAGKSIENFGEGLLGERKTRKEIYTDPIKEGVVGATAEMGGQALSKGIQAAANSPLAKKVGQKIGSGAARVGEALTGVPKNEIKAYAKHADEINDMAKSADYDAQEMADQLRGKFNDAIQIHRQQLNGRISNALKTNGGAIQSQPIIDALQTAKANINPRRYADQVGQIDEMIQEVNSSSVNGNIPLADAHDLKEWLRSFAKGTYQKAGQIFQTGDKAAGAAKHGASVARKAIDKVAPEVASGNAGLSRLHDIEDVMNKNLFTEGKTAASLYAAGSGGNPANAKVLRQIGDETGVNMLGQAEKMAAARTFGKPQFMPIDSNGKAVGRMALGGLGGAVLGIPGGPATMAAGAAIGGAVASPAALKFAIDGGRGVGRAAGAVARSSQAVGSTLRPALRGAPGERTSDESPKQEPSVPSGDVDRVAEKGPKKWQQDGFKKLIEHATKPESKQKLEKIKEAILKEPKGQNLLIAASDLKPGSKAMENLLAKIEREYGGAK